MIYVTWGLQPFKILIKISHPNIYLDLITSIWKTILNVFITPCHKRTFLVLSPPSSQEILGRDKPLFIDAITTTLANGGGECCKFISKLYPQQTFHWKFSLYKVCWYIARSREDSLSLSLAVSDFRKPAVNNHHQGIYLRFNFESTQLIAYLYQGRDQTRP